MDGILELTSARNNRRPQIEVAASRGRIILDAIAKYSNGDGGGSAYGDAPDFI